MRIRRCIVAQEGEELVILDQHGAHERILYERLSKNPRAEPVPLPSPVVARLPGDLAPEVSNFEVELQALGFRFEPFGEGAVRISSAPATVTDPEIALLAALHALAGGEDLASEEMEVLLREWSATEFRDTNPRS